VFTRRRATMTHLTGLVAATSALEPTLTGLSGADLAAYTPRLRDQLAAGAGLEEVLPTAFALAREAALRVLGQRPFDVQVLGAAAMAHGNIAQMATGEGKTLTAALTSYLAALTGPVHVVTVNDYLATRDATLLAPVHAALGLTVGVVTDTADQPTRARAYAADITYGTVSTFAFDYLRDNLATDPADQVQRGRHLAIVDEADSVLIDTARTPIVLSAPAADQRRWVAAMVALAADLEPGTDYDIDTGRRTVGLTAAGAVKAADLTGSPSLFTARHAHAVGLLHQALRAKELYRAGRDYVVTGDQVVLLDEHTGRLRPGHRAGGGLHQCLEALAGVPVRPESRTIAQVSVQNYLRGYQHLAGMTGTATSEATELWDTYRLGVIDVPTNRPCRRVDEMDVVYRTHAAKLDAVLAEVTAAHATGQPVLLGAPDLLACQELSDRLTQAGIAHQLLNATNHEAEAAVIAQAGRVGAVTVATTMAGRGTDIILGGNPEALADTWLAERHPDLDPAGDHARAVLEDLLTEAAQLCATERAQVLAAGGLYVIGTSRGESVRADDQLRGRAGRQGDPGRSRFYLSLEDEAITRFAGNMLARAVDTLGAGDRPVRSTLVTNAVRTAQEQTRVYHAKLRADLLAFDDVLHAHRDHLYRVRQEVLTAPAGTRWALDRAAAALAALVRSHAGGPGSELAGPAAALLGVDLDGLKGTGTPQDVALELLSRAEEGYAELEQALGAAEMDRRERVGMLRALDRAWAGHLQTLEYLRAGIALRAQGGTDPVVAYRREADGLFTDLMGTVGQDLLAELLRTARPTARGEQRALSVSRPVS
jgi:preprotein translocase subunit SecA